MTLDAFNTALIISYCRPFSTRCDLDEKRESKLDGNLAEVLNEEEEIEMHARMKRLRDESYGHSDARSRLFPKMDYTKDFCVLKGKRNLSRCEVELLRKMILKWIKYLDKQISLAKPSGFLIAPDAGS